MCSEYFQGRAGSIKEYNIAVEALSRSPEFSPVDDSIVRVEISRIRKRIQQYYAAEGALHPIRMLLPESGYAIQFVRREAGPEILPSLPAPAPLTAPGPVAPVAPAPLGLPGIFKDRKSQVLLAAVVENGEPPTRNVLTYCTT
jgi:hypothetical protein